MTELFDKKYVHFMWEDELEGKKGFFADSIEILINRVNTNYDTCEVQRSASIEFPFYGFEAGWKFFYYDPNYECKRAFAEGKQIQLCGPNGSWIDCDEPEWIEDIKYRIKPEEQLQKKINTTTVSDYPYSALKLEEAKEIIKGFIDAEDGSVQYYDLLNRAEQFLNDEVKE